MNIILKRIQFLIDGRTGEVSLLYHLTDEQGPIAEDLIKTYPLSLLDPQATAQVKNLVKLVWDRVRQDYNLLPAPPADSLFKVKLGVMTAEEIQRLDGKQKVQRGLPLVPLTPQEIKTIQDQAKLGNQRMVEKRPDLYEEES
mgnify:CR=1 FL=1